MRSKVWRVTRATEENENPFSRLTYTPTCTSYCHTKCGIGLSSAPQLKCPKRGFLMKIGIFKANLSPKD